MPEGRAFTLRRHPEMSLVRNTEVAGMLITDLECDFGDGHVATTKQAPCFFHPAISHIFENRHAIDGPEGLGELGLICPGIARQDLHDQRLGIIVIDVQPRSLDLCKGSLIQQAKRRRCRRGKLSP